MSSTAHREPIAALVEGAAYPVRLDDRRVWAATIVAVHPTPDGLLRASFWLNAPQKPPPVSAAGAEVVDQDVRIAENLMAEYPVWSRDLSHPYLVSVKLRPTSDEPLAWLTLTPELTEESLPLEVPVPLRTDWHTLAEDDNYRRTSGRLVTKTNHIPGGVQTAAKVHAIIERYARASGRILDWGIGAGRVAVPLKRLFRPAADLVGADIDAVNALWCQENLRDIPTELSDLYPPLSFEDASLDVVFGISVMTHLSRSAQLLWLRELRRVLRPGGLAILSVNGDYSLVARSFSEQVIQELREEGISDSSADPAIELRESDYYRGTFQTRAQVEDVWSRELPIVAYLPMANQIRQDFVVLGKP